MSVGVSCVCLISATLGFCLSLIFHRLCNFPYNFPAVFPSPYKQCAFSSLTPSVMLSRDIYHLPAVQQPQAGDKKNDATNKEERGEREAGFTGFTIKSQIVLRDVIIYWYFVIFFRSSRNQQQHFFPPPKAHKLSKNIKIFSCAYFVSHVNCVNSVLCLMSGRNSQANSVAEGNIFVSDRKVFLSQSLFSLWQRTLVRSTDETIRLLFPSSFLFLRRI